MAKQKEVTRDSLQKMLNKPHRPYVAQVIGRALVHIYNRQTASEQNCSETIEANGIGFTGADGRYGSWCAKLFIKEGRLADKTLNKWLKKNDNGYSRITKYHKQLNEVVEERQDQMIRQIKGV